MKEVEQSISGKVSIAVHHLPVKGSQQSPIARTGQKRSATHLQSNEANDFFNLLNLYRLHSQGNHQMLL